MRQKIAIFRALYLGDMLLSVPALRALRQGYPGAEITLIGLPWAASFARRYPDYLDRFVEFAGYPGLPELEVSPQRTRNFIKDQRAYQYDLAIQMHGNGQVSNAFINELQARASAGYFPAWASRAEVKLTSGAPYPADRHEIDRQLDLVAMLGCTERERRLEFPLWPEDFREIRQVLADLPRNGSPWVGLHVGAKHPARRWPPAYFAQLANALVRDWHASVILTGSTDERSTAQYVIDQMDSKPVNLAGQTSLGGLAALLSALDLFICNDTGPAHLAYALDTPSITLFGPTDYRRWRPLAQQRHIALRVPVACSPCAFQECPIDQRCLKQLTPPFVAEAAAQCLEHGTARARHRERISTLFHEKAHFSLLGSS